MIDTLIRTLKGVLPDGTWDFIQPSYTAVLVSKDYMLMKELISLNGIVLLCGHPDLLSHMLQRVRGMESDRPIIVVLEDIDEIIDKHGEHAILSMLDGEKP